MQLQGSSFTAAGGQVVYLDAQFGSSLDFSFKLKDVTGTMLADGPFDGPLTAVDLRTHGFDDHAAASVGPIL